MPKIRDLSKRYMKAPQRQRKGREMYYFVPYRNEWLTAHQIHALPECNLTLASVRSRLHRVVIGREHCYKDFKALITNPPNHGGSTKKKKEKVGFDAKASDAKDPCWFIPPGSLAHTVR